MTKTITIPTDTILRETLTRGGFSYDLQSQSEAKHTSGYVVSRDNGAWLPVNASDLQTKFNAAIADVLSRHASAPIVGTWIDSGILYIDASDIYSSLSDAMQVGRANNQRTIWDFATSTIIPVE